MQIKRKKHDEDEHDQGGRTNLLPRRPIDKFGFLLHFSEEFRQTLGLRKQSTPALCTFETRFLFILFRQDAPFLSGFTGCQHTRSQTGA